MAEPDGKADASALMGCWAAANLSPNYNELRPPEIGSVMVRGRMGGRVMPSIWVK